MTFSVKTGLFSLVLLLLLAPPIQANEVSCKPVPEKRIHDLEERLLEIREIQFSSLSKEERKALRKEVKAIKKELSESGGGIYLGAGAGVMVLFLVILMI